MTSKKSNTESIDTKCLEYAKYHTIMVMLLVVFLGILILPLFFKQIQYSQYKKAEGIVKSVFYSQEVPSISFVDISYKIGDDEYNVKETLKQKLQINDHIIIYIDPDTKHVRFYKPNIFIYITLLIVYLLIFFTILARLWRFFNYKK